MKNGRKIGSTRRNLATVQLPYHKSLMAWPEIDLGLALGEIED
jgi:hypothetical protein